MRVVLTFLAIAVVIATATYALPVQCADCFFSGSPCWGNDICGQGCSCIRINGPGKAGVCQ